MKKFLSVLLIRQLTPLFSRSSRGNYRMMNSQKGFAPIIIILIATVIIAGGAAGYFLVLKQEPIDVAVSPPGSLSTAGSGEQGAPVEPSPKTLQTPQLKKATVSTDPELLEGLWRIETAYDWVNPPGVWEKSEELKMRRPYQEFKNGTMCRLWGVPFEVSTAPPKNLEEALEYTYCNGYKSFRIVDRREFKPKDPEVSVIAFSDKIDGHAFQWKIIDGKLEFDKNIYVKIPGTREKPAFKDTEKPKITSFKLSSPSVRVGDEITLTCSATDNSGTVLIVFDITGIIAGGTSNVASGGQYHVSEGSDTYTYKLLYAGNYTATCQAADQAQNKAESSLAFSVSQ